MINTSFRYTVVIELMNELFILGELMEEPQSGYDLHHALKVSLGRHRKISYGVIYPLLERLQQKKFVEMTATDKGDGKNKKIATITEKGRERFFELMKMPVPNGAHNDDIYLIKLDVMQHLALEEQIQLLEQFYQEQKHIVEDTEKILMKLAEENSKDHWYAGKKFGLRLQQAKIAMEWIDQFKYELRNNE